LNEYPDVNGPAQHRYLFVKANDGNLLEVITSNDRIPYLTQWTEITTAINELQNHVKIYPNPTSGQLRIMNYALNQVQGQIENIEILDVMGRAVGIAHPPLRGGLEGLDISDLPTGTYFLRITTNNGTITEKIIKN
jgi:hypothetical protein